MIRPKFVGGALALLFTMLAPARAHAQSGGFVLIVNPANAVTSLRADQVSKLFLKKVPRWPSGAEVVPVDLPENAAPRVTFSQIVHKRPVAAVQSYWQQQIFSGRDTPPSTKSADEVLAFVRSNPGAIAYVAPGTDLRGVKMVNVVF